MRHLIFEENPNGYQVAILVKSTAFLEHELRAHYMTGLVNRGIPASDQIAFTLRYNEAGKAPAGLIKDYLAKLLDALERLGTEYLYVTDAAYFRVLTGNAKGKVDAHFGYVLPCKVKGYEHMKVVLGLNYQQLIYNPELQAKLDLSLHTLASHINGSYQAIGSGIIHSAHYPQSHEDIAAALYELHRYPNLTADIEGFSLDFDKAGIGTISFAWDQHNGIAFACDYVELPEPVNGNYGVFAVNPTVRTMLKEFLEQYQGCLTWHNGSYDIKAIIYALWMRDPLDTEGLLEGLEIMTRDFDDTKIITYLATNSTAGNILRLKHLAHEFAGNWAKDEIEDIRKIPLPELLQYNLVDALSTAYVKQKYYPVMVADKQEELYEELLLPSMKLIIQMELTGMPQNPKMIKEVKAKLNEIRDQHLRVINNHPLVLELNERLTESAWQKDFEDRRFKAKNPDKIKPKDRAFFPRKVFNPDSDPQKRRLLYEVMGLPVIDLTDTKQPATGAKTVAKLIHHTKDEGHKALLEALIGYGEVAILLQTFIPSFEKGIVKSDGMSWLHGCFNIGGTVSGRLSSSDPNLQNIPAGETGSEAKQMLGQLIKQCFQAPKGWLFAGADFNSLEDMISALTTRDPNKLAVYERGFDGHCLRAAYYFRPQLTHIDLNDPDSVNSIKTTHPYLRQKSKSPTFALTYLGTWHTLVNTLGFEEEEAKEIERNYHKMYQVSDEYVQKRLKQASKDGYVTVAFGLRVRTPMLKQVVWDGPKMPYEAAAEGRTAGNALGQSYGLLNNRAVVDFFRKVWASKYRYDIKPVALIHDAIYVLFRDDAEVAEWVNRELIASMRWQELPELQHDTVKLGAKLNIFWPTWANPIEIPNDADQKTIRAICDQAKVEFHEAHA